MTMSVVGVLADTAAQRPDHSAVIYESEHFSYGWLWEQARRYASVLRANGVRPGDRVAMLLVDTPQFPVVYFGVLAAGAVAIPLSVMSTASEIDHVLTDADARFLVCAAALLAQAREAAEPLGTVLLTVGPGPAGTVDLENAAQDAAPIDESAVREPDDVAVVFYTSGTTGRPKGVMLTHRNILHNVERMVTTPYMFRSDDVLLGCLPLSHGFGQICGMLTGFRAGISIVMMPRFSGREALALMTKHRCTVFMGVPTMYFGLLDAVAQGEQVPRLDRVYSGGSALPVKTLDDVRSVFGCPVYEGYGMTETSCSVAYHYPGMTFRSGTVGVPITGITVGIARPNADGIDLLPVGEVGEIVVRGPNVMAGYLGRPETTAEVLIDGWFLTGDLGRLDGDGYLSVVGRKKDLILRGGYNVYPREIEEILVGHPGVAQVAVIGVPHPVLGEEVWAIVVPARPEDAASGSDEEIIEWGKQRLAAYKYPRRVEFTDALPLGSSGKVLKRMLVSKYEQTVGS
ncbi:long-chain fatty acid--CoA ligase [Streptomyces yokosukanensis]|uniref:Long-chain fatty acid--CoA ligase n=1 Tax=Streptomyces yokosukanensis TaxID=67386 RepID=A0A101P424_9ACTN|nr:long-chain fatty acid--CoA ligase [Streptomyces yokosukanensis]KUN04537.1 long-chain fatty acid--CoA ligase [Streptomyces yokosukanensis]